MTTTDGMNAASPFAPDPALDASVPDGVPAEHFEALLAAGRAHGTITGDDLIVIVKDVELTPELIASVVQRVKEEGITYVEDEPSADEAEAAVLEAVEAVEAEVEPVPARTARTGASRPVVKARNAPSTFDDDRGGGTDFVRMYMREIGKVPLLTGDQEVSLAEPTARSPGTI